MRLAVLLVRGCVSPSTRCRPSSASLNTEMHFSMSPGTPDDLSLMATLVSARSVLGLSGPRTRRIAASVLCAYAWDSSTLPRLCRMPGSQFHSRALRTHPTRQQSCEVDRSYGDRQGAPGQCHRPAAVFPLPVTDCAVLPCSCSLRVHGVGTNGTVTSARVGMPTSSSGDPSCTRETAYRARINDTYFDLLLLCPLPSSRWV